MIINSGITSIASCAFCYCPCLELVSIPHTVTSIGRSAFDHCYELKEVTIPSSVKEMGSEAFRGCSKLTCLTIEPGLTEIDNNAFAGAGIKSVVLPDTLLNVKYNAFYSCKKLTDIWIPASVTEMSGNAFQGCMKLTLHGIEGSYAQTWAGINSVSFSTSSVAPIVKQGVYSANISWTLDSDDRLYLTGMGEIPSLVYGELNPLESLQRSVKRIVFESGITNVGDYSFNNWQNMIEVTLADTVARIGNSAFSDCFSLEKVNLSEGLKTIHAYAFDNCISLKELTLPESVNYIDESAINTWSHMTLIGAIGSYAQRWALSHGFSYITLNGVRILDSGAYGDNLTWTLDEEGTLTLTGTARLNAAPIL